MEKKSKKSIIIGITSLLLVTLILLGLTYAYYRTRIIGNTNDKSISVTSKKLELTYADGDAYFSTGSQNVKIEPGFNYSKEFTVENTGDEKVYYTVVFDNVSNTFEREGDWIYRLTNTTTNEKVDGEINNLEEQIVLANIGIESKATDRYKLEIEYQDLENEDQSDDMGATLTLRVNIREGESIESQSIAFSLIENSSFNTDGNVIGKTNYMVTDYIPVEPGYLYTVTENQTFPVTSGTYTQCFIYDEDKNSQGTIYGENRTEQRVYTHRFEISDTTSYIRIQFRMTDEDITITKTPLSSLDNLLYIDNAYIQGIAVSDDYIFAGYSPTKSKNGYYLRKIDRATGEVISTSSETFNHTNDITYNKNTNEVIITALNGETGATSTTSDDDYSLYVVDANTFSLKETVNLKDEVLSVCSESVGIAAVAYNSNLNECYVLTRYPERHIIILDSDFEMKSSVFLANYEDLSGTIGGIYVDDNYFYLSNTVDEMSAQNEVLIYNINGNLIDTKSINGSIHMEGLDYVDGKYYASFIGNYNSSFAGRIYEMEELKDLY